MSRISYMNSTIASNARWSLDSIFLSKVGEAGVLRDGQANQNFLLSAIFPYGFIVRCGYESVEDIEGIHA